MTSEPQDPFARISEAASAFGATAAAGSVGAADVQEHVAPAPDNAPKPREQWRELGRPAARWTYLDAKGAVLRYTLRFENASGEKDIRPMTLWRKPEDQSLIWRLKSEPGPRPLYGLDRLAARPTAPVLVVEGEKTADAAAERLPEFVCITWPGGSNAIAKADFAPLKGRSVLVWPDADDPGRKAAKAVVLAAMAAGAALAADVSPPWGFPKGWDLADAWPPGFEVQDARDLLSDAMAGAAAALVEWPPGYRMDPGGLWFDEQKDGGVVPRWLCEPFEVLGEARARDGSGWSVVLQFRSRDGQLKIVPVSRAKLASGGGDARASLADAGLVFDPNRGRADKLTAALMRVRTSRRIVLAEATGWAGDLFVLPNQTFGPPGGEPVLFTGDTPSLNYASRGTLDGWRDGVAAMAGDNSALTFALSVAFAAPLLRPLGAEGGGFHFRGNSSAGKSTLLLAAGSVWGGSTGEQGFGHTWRATANALENLALAHNDLVMCLDEFRQVDPAEAGVAAYALSNGQGKARLKSDGSLRKKAEWLLFFLSSGELSLADHMRSNAKGGEPAVGQELRLVDIPAEAGKGMGIWEYLHDAPGPAQLSEDVKAAARAHYGHAGLRFLERLVPEREKALNQVREGIRAFLTQAIIETDTGQIRRVAARFALVAAAGELAASWDIVPWEGGAAQSAALALFRRWADGFGRDAPREEREVLRRLRDAIQSDRSAFASAGPHDVEKDSEPSIGGRDGEARALRTLGYRHVSGNEVRYLFHEAGWATVFKGMDLEQAARTVKAAGYLETDSGERRLKKRVRVRGESSRFYCVNGSIQMAPLGD